MIDGWLEIETFCKTRDGETAALGSLQGRVADFQNSQTAHGVGIFFCSAVVEFRKRDDDQFALLARGQISKCVGLGDDDDSLIQAVAVICASQRPSEGQPHQARIEKWARIIENEMTRAEILRVFEMQSGIETELRELEKTAKWAVALAGQHSSEFRKAE